MHHGTARKAASAMIAKIPLPLSRHIAMVFKPKGCIFPCDYCGQKITVPHSQHYETKGPDECTGEWVRYESVVENQGHNKE
jgi:hypothetical protein